MLHALTRTHAITLTMQMLVLPAKVWALGEILRQTPNAIAQASIAASLPSQGMLVQQRSPHREQGYLIETLGYGMLVTLLREYLRKG